MSGYELIAKGYEDYVNKHPDMSDENREHFLQKAKIIRLVDGFTESDVELLFESGVLNSIYERYILLAMLNCKMPKEKVNQVMSELKWLLDNTLPGDMKK